MYGANDQHTAPHIIYFASPNPPPPPTHQHSHHTTPPQLELLAAPVTLEQRLAERRLKHQAQRRFIDAQTEFINRRLRESFPADYVLKHTVVIALVGLFCIYLQIKLILNNAPNSYMCNGIWGGLICIAAGVSSFLLCKKNGNIGLTHNKILKKHTILPLHR
jgi:hypothetical protein